jgi:hypothetical protein
VGVLGLKRSHTHLPARGDATHGVRTAAPVRERIARCFRGAEPCGRDSLSRQLVYSWGVSCDAQQQGPGSWWALRLSNNAICSWMDSFRLRAQRFPSRHARHRSSEQFWHILQSGHCPLADEGCFESDCILSPTMIVRGFFWISQMRTLSQRRQMLTNLENGICS